MMRPLFPVRGDEECIVREARAVAVAVAHRRGGFVAGGSGTLVEVGLGAVFVLVVAGFAGEAGAAVEERRHVGDVLLLGEEVHRQALERRTAAEHTRNARHQTGARRCVDRSIEQPQGHVGQRGAVDEGRHELGHLGVLREEFRGQRFQAAAVAEGLREHRHVG